jgi:hypothetical protein
MNKVGCLAGMLGGFCSFGLQYAAFGTQSFGGFDPFVWSLGVSGIGAVAGSLMSSKDPAALLEPYFGS